ncbi:MAG: DUF2238 domain-containing protein [Bacteroidetes bacterium]|nr:DUF2238 domain-containing protein [Bacteroidota bacterium]
MKLSSTNSRHRTALSSNTWLKVFLFIFAAVWVDSFVGTTDRVNWLIENSLVFITLAFLAYTYKRYQFSDLSYLLIGIFLCLHIYGSKYTYAENPFGYWLQDVFQTSRNHYDRLIHFGFGLLLAYPMREMFLKWLKYPRWVSWMLPIGIALSVGTIYELIEWGVADIFFPEQGDAYLGTQGDIWDAQKDIFLGVLGAIVATVFFSLVKKLGKINKEGK